MRAEEERSGERSGLAKRPVGRPSTANSRGTLLAATTSAQLKEALGRIAEQAATIRRLQQLVRVAERRAEIAEDCAKRIFALVARR